MSTLKVDALTTKSDNADLTITGGGTGVPNLETGYKVNGTVEKLTGIAPSTSGNVLTSDGTDWTSAAAAGVTQGTSVATTSGTSIDFTSIPSTVKSITIMLDAVSTNGGSQFLLQIGDSGGIESSGYLGNHMEQNVAGTDGVVTISSTAGFEASGGRQSAFITHAIIQLFLRGASNEWMAVITSSSNMSPHKSINFQAAGKTLSGTLDRIRLTTVGGSDTFDSGNMNILYS